MRLRLAAVVVGLSLLGACGPDASNQQNREPAKQVQNLLSAIDRGDCSVVKKLVVTPSAIDCDLIADAAGSLADQGVDLAQVTYEKTDESSDNVTVRINWGNELPPEQFELTRIDDVWKIEFDSAA